MTGEPADADEYRTRHPDGKAMIKAAAYVAPQE